MKVVQVLPRLNEGGVERGTIEIARYLVQRGHEVIVISEGGILVQELELLGIPHIVRNVGSKSLKSHRGVAQLRNFFDKKRPDIVHSRSRLPNWLCFRAIRQLPAHKQPRFVTSVHGLHSVSWYSASITKGERIEVVSKATRDYLLKNYPKVDPKRVRLIFRGVDPKEYHSHFEPHADWKEAWNRWCIEHRVDSAAILTMVGRITRLKGHHDFLDIIEKLHQMNISTIGLIVGTMSDSHSSLLDELTNRVNRSEVLRHRVHFLGHRSDVRELVKMSDVVVSLSEKPEAFGRTVLEALSLGVPALGYDHGGVREILHEVFPVGAVPVGDTAAAAEQIRTLLTEKHPISTHSMTLEAMCAQTLSMYQELVE